MRASSSSDRSQDHRDTLPGKNVHRSCEAVRVARFKVLLNGGELAAVQLFNGGFDHAAQCLLIESPPRVRKKLKRQKAAAVAMGDRESAKSLSAKLKEKQLAMNRFCEQNGLKRDWNRKAVAQEMQPKNAGFDYGTGDESFSRIAGDHSVDEDIRAANPNYATGERRWTMNCQRTAPAYEMRRRGYDVTAKPLPDHYETDPPLAAAGGCFEAFENAEVIRVPLGNGRKQIEEQMAKWGDGARAMIRIRNLGNGFGHAFCCEQISGKTVYVDPQSGLNNVSSLLTNVAGGSTMFARVDHLKPSELISECCEKREESTEK